MADEGGASAAAIEGEDLKNAAECDRGSVPAS